MHQLVVFKANILCSLWIKYFLNYKNSIAELLFCYKFSCQFSHLKDLQKKTACTACNKQRDSSGGPFDFLKHYTFYFLERDSSGGPFNFLKHYTFLFAGPAFFNILNLAHNSQSKTFANSSNLCNHTNRTFQHFLFWPDQMMILHSNGCALFLSCKNRHSRTYTYIYFNASKSVKFRSAEKKRPRNNKGHTLIIVGTETCCERSNFFAHSSVCVGSQNTAYHVSLKIFFKTQVIQKLNMYRINHFHSLTRIMKIQGKHGCFLIFEWRMLDPFFQAKNNTVLWYKLLETIHRLRFWWQSSILELVG